MFIYQNLLKAQLLELEFVREEYTGQNTELIASTLAHAYTYKNELFKALNLTYQIMYQEFLEFLQKHKYQWILVYYEKEGYAERVFNIIAIISYTDVNDVRPTQLENQIVNLDLVPEVSRVRQYVRLKALKYFFERYNPKYGDFCVTGAFAFSQKHMGARQSLKIYTDSIKFIKSKGYKYGFGWTANDIAKNLYDKLHLVLREEQTLSNIFVAETNSWPYKNIRMIQVLYIGEVNESIVKLENILRNKQQS